MIVGERLHVMLSTGLGCALALTLSTGSARASLADARLLLTCKGGLSFGGVSSSQSGREGRRISLEAGLSATYRLSQKMGAEFGIDYAARGGIERYVKYTGRGEVEDTWEIDYLVLPLCARYDLGTKSPHPYFLIGSEVAILLGATLERRVPVTYEYQKNPRRFDETDRFAPVTPALRAGGGVTLDLERTAMSVEVCYVYGLAEAFDAIDLRTDAILLLVSVSVPVRSR